MFIMVIVVIMVIIVIMIMIYKVIRPKQQFLKS
jgi:hypothetical protein